jgi:hypothetical protein
MRRWRLASSRGGTIGGPQRWGLYLGGGFFLQGRRGVSNSPSGSLADGELWSRMCGDKAQASTFSDDSGELQGIAHDKVGQNGCGTGCRSPTSGWWSSSSVTCGAVMKGVNLGFASLFNEIMYQGSSIYRGFGLMISCMWRTPSPSHLIHHTNCFPNFFPICKLLWF